MKAIQAPVVRTRKKNRSLKSGADPGFQVSGGMYLKKLWRAEGGANIFGVFRVKNQDFTPKNHINFWHISSPCEKSRFYVKK
jgi:hypothetical protein